LRAKAYSWIVAVVGLAGCSAAPGDVPQALATDGQGQESAACDALAVVQAKCVRCHSDPPQNGAPFSLVDYAATQELAPSSKDPERTRADRMLSAVDLGYMPDTQLALDPPVEPLTCEEKTTLLAWLRAGAEPPPDAARDCHGIKTHLLACDADP